MNTRIANAHAEPALTCPAQGSCGCKSNPVDCRSDVVRAHERISRFQCPPPHRSFPYSDRACVDKSAKPSKSRCHLESGQEESGYSASDSSAPGNGVS